MEVGAVVGVAEAYEGCEDGWACATAELQAAAAALELYEELRECRGSWNMYG